MFPRKPSLPKRQVMKKATITTIPAICALLLGAIPAIAAEGATDVQIDIPYKKFVLTNGLTLIVHEDHKAPIVAVNLWYQLASKKEKGGKTGFSPLFEHLLFNGSGHFKWC